MGAPEGRRELADEEERLLARERPALQAVAERPAAEERHDDPAFLPLAPRVEEGDEPLGEREAREEPLLPLEGGGRLGVVLEEDLERDLPSVGGACAVDGAHAAAADLGEDLVVAEARAPGPHADSFSIPRSLRAFAWSRVSARA